jgi:hypothetical protein
MAGCKASDTLSARRLSLHSASWVSLMASPDSARSTTASIDAASGNRALVAIAPKLARLAPLSREQGRANASPDSKCQPGTTAKGLLVAAKSPPSRPSQSPVWSLVTPFAGSVDAATSC